MLKKMAQYFGVWVAGVMQERDLQAPVDADARGVKPEGVSEILKCLFQIT